MIFKILLSVLFSLPMYASQSNQIIEWAPCKKNYKSLYCYVKQSAHYKESVDQTICNRWGIQNKQTSFFSPYSIQIISTNRLCENTECIECPAITPSEWELITKEQQFVRETFLYIPASVLRHDTGTRKKNGDLLFSATVGEKYYDVYLMVLPCLTIQDDDAVSLPFFQRQDYKRTLLVLLFTGLIPVYMRCTNKERKNIFTFTVMSLFSKLCSLR